MRRLGLVLLVALVFALTGPVTAGAQLQTFGSTLASPSNLAFGCEAVPTIVDVGGNQAPVASGAPDCTWANTGGGTIPGDGTVTRITIKSGPNPAPIRFVVLRTLAQPGMGSFCCFFVAETSVSQPAPNSVQSFNVNLPVERNTNPATQVMSQDNIGVSAAAGTGTLPVFDNGRHNILDPINPALNASFYYPRVSSATDTGSGVRATGSAGGYEVLLQDQFCPKGQEAACGIGGGGGGGNGGGNGGGGGGNGGGGGGDTAPPQIAQPRFVPTVFRVGEAATPVAATASGATLSFVLSETAVATIRIQRRGGGRRVKGVCRAVRSGKGRRCTRWTSAGAALTRANLPAGAVQIAFSGRIGRKALRPGSYRAQVTAKDAAGNVSKVAGASFKIVAQ